MANSVVNQYCLKHLGGYFRLMVTVQLWPWVVSYSVTKPSFSLSSIVDLFSWTYFFSLIDSANSGEKGKERATRWFLRWLTGRERDGKSSCRQKSEDKLPCKTFSAFMPPVFFPWASSLGLGYKEWVFFSSLVVSSLVDSVHSCRYSANLVSRALFTVVQWKGSDAIIDPKFLTSHGVL